MSRCGGILGLVGQLKPPLPWYITQTRNNPAAYDEMEVFSLGEACEGVGDSRVRQGIRTISAGRDQDQDQGTEDSRTTGRHSLRQATRINILRS